MDDSSNEDEDDDVPPPMPMPMAKTKADNNSDDDDTNNPSTSTATKATAAARKKSPMSMKEKLAKLRSRGSGARKKGKSKKSLFPAASTDASSSSKPKKIRRGKSQDRMSQEELDALDFSKPTNSGNSSNNNNDGEDDDDTVPVDISALNFDSDDDKSDSDEDEKDEAYSAKGGMFSFLTSLVTGKELTKEDLEPVLVTFREKLIEKNVASEVSSKLCDSVVETLVGHKVGTFSTIKSTVKKSLEAALTRILTPKRSVDILQGVLKARREKRPFSIVMVGVNGVGKSTSLAKLVAYLLSKEMTVSIAACDTFRSGAIEQLRTHSRRLQVELFERGYSKDAASVAMAGIKNAEKKGHDAVLIDTAGRMQDNEPLMRSLSKLVNINNPDLILFVGEALVGNDAVDQLTKFNRALADLYTDTTQTPRCIDGILLTKFDTIDDKVGTAVSLSYASGLPIMFVGTGQDYKDLKKMNVKTLTKALLKD